MLVAFGHVGHGGAQLRIDGVAEERHGLGGERAQLLVLGVLVQHALVARRRLCQLRVFADGRALLLLLLLLLNVGAGARERIARVVRQRVGQRVLVVQKVNRRVLLVGRVVRLLRRHVRHKRRSSMSRVQVRAAVAAAAVLVGEHHERTGRHHQATAGGGRRRRHARGLLELSRQIADVLDVRAGGCLLVLERQWQ